MARTRSDIGPRIVEAARARFLREGVDGASLRAIAKDARTSIGMVYYYFPTKDDLFFAVVEETYGVVLEDMTRACAADVAPAERMRRVYQRVAALTEREALTIRLVLREVLVSSTRFRRLFARFERGHFPLVLATLADGIADGTFRGDLPPTVMLVLALSIGALPQFLLQQVKPSRTAKASSLPDMLLDVLLHGLGAAKPPRPKRVLKRAR